MRRTIGTLAGVCLALTAAGPVRADDQAEIKAVIDKAVKAHGGEANLAKYQGVTFKGKGKFYGLGDGIDYTAEWAIQAKDQYSVDAELTYLRQKHPAGEAHASRADRPGPESIAAPVETPR